MKEQGREKKDKEQEERLRHNLAKISNKFIVISGKGGVGKTTVAVNLAYGLALRGCRVGILDVDLHGPNVAKMLGIEGRQLSGSEAGGIEPVMVSPGLKVVSMAFLLENADQPVIWRGPLKMIAIKQFLSDVYWGELDYLIIDSPPGTGDEPLSVCQIINNVDGAIIVTTPQDVAVLDSRKCVLFARQLKVPVVGIVENMSGFFCPHCKKEVNLFGRGGGEKAAGDLKVPFWGRIPVEPEMVSCGDSGQPLIGFRGGTATAAVMKALVDKIIHGPKTDQVNCGNVQTNAQI